MDLYIDTNVFIARFAMYEQLQYDRANELFRSITQCKHTVVFSDVVEEELAKKSKEQNVNYLAFLKNLETLKKAVKLPCLGGKRENVECTHAKDRRHIEYCIANKLHFVCFDRKTSDCAKEKGVDTYDMDNIYML